jgi:two-component system, OmpR family, alkaline phosphatase synthesis response regulator PhoP
MKPRVLLIEDEPDLVVVVSDLLRSEGYTVATEFDGRIGLDRAVGEDFDLLILDVMLPGATGLDICRAVRQQGFDGAILMLTARVQLQDRVLGLRTGADDYMVKPFAPAELLARAEALLRRARKENLTPVMRFQFGNVIVNFADARFTKSGRPIALAPKEAELLRLLINHRGKVLARQVILEQVWKEQKFITAKTVDVHIAWLRQKLEDDPQTPRFIMTIRGTGYCFRA